MANDKRRGLGRGLSALMSDVSDIQAQEPSAGVQTLPIELIQPNPDQPRKSFSQAELEDLARSISAKGVIQPLIVRRTDETYQIVAGERRWRAAQIAQLHDLPVVVRDFTDIEVLEVGIIENVQREDLNPIEEALAYRQLIEKFGHTQSQLSEALGKSRSHVANIMRLLQLPGDVVALVQEGRLSSGHARALITAENPSDLARQVLAKGLSVRETEELVRKVQATGSAEKPARPSIRPEKDADTKALQDDLSAALSMKVDLNHKPGAESGQITIHYRSLDELDHLCSKLGS